MTGNILEHLRKIDVANRLGKLKNEQEHQQKTEQFLQSGVAFASSRKSLEEVFYSALGQLFDCITVTKDGEPVLLEGGPIKEVGWRALEPSIPKFFLGLFLQSRRRHFHSFPGFSVKTDSFLINGRKMALLIDKFKWLLPCHGVYGTITA